MTEPVKKLPDCDSIKGISLSGNVVEIQYERARDPSWYQLSMTLPNALYLLSLLSNLPGADRTLERAREMREPPPTG